MRITVFDTLEIIWQLATTENVKYSLFTYNIYRVLTDQTIDNLEGCNIFSNNAFGKYAMYKAFSCIFRHPMNNY